MLASLKFDKFAPPHLWQIAKMDLSSGSTIRLHAHGNALLHLRHHRDAALWQPGPHHCHHHHHLHIWSKYVIPFVLITFLIFR